MSSAPAGRRLGDVTPPREKRKDDGKPGLVERLKERIGSDEDAPSRPKAGSASG
jgi:hypothetical protein